MLCGGHMMRLSVFKEKEKRLPRQSWVDLWAFRLKIKESILIYIMIAYGQKMSWDQAPRSSRDSIKTETKKVVVFLCSCMYINILISYSVFAFLTSSSFSAVFCSYSAFFQSPTWTFESKARRKKMFTI